MMAGTAVVAVAVCDEGAVDRSMRVDVKAGRRAPEALRPKIEQVRRAHARKIGASRRGGKARRRERAADPRHGGEADVRAMR
jgi:hypothetical protein